MSIDESPDLESAEEAPGSAAMEALDDGLLDLLSWLLDTETRARIYLYLRLAPARTSGEVADGTGLYPSTVRECLAAMHEDDLVDRQKRASEGAGNNPYEYTAIPPADLVGELVAQLQEQLNTICNLDNHLETQPPENGDQRVTIELLQASDD